MRRFWFGSKLGATTLTCFAAALLAAPAQAQNDDNSGRDEPRSSARGEKRSAGEARPESDSDNRAPRRARSTRRPERPTLGVVLYNDDSNPLEIRRVLPGSAAENAGLERGDEILSINGRRVSTVDQLKRHMARLDGDEDFEIGILRDGRKQTLDTSLSNGRFARGRDRGDDQGDRAFLGVALDDRARSRVWVTGVYPESPADEAGIRDGDEIVAIDDEEVESNRDLQWLLSQKEPADTVTITIDRDGRERTLRATLASQQEVVAASRAAYRVGRRDSYQRSPGDRDGYRDGQSDNRGRQRDDSRADEGDAY